jgi:hypothetical protein
MQWHLTAGTGDTASCFKTATNQSLIDGGLQGFDFPLTAVFALIKSDPILQGCGRA